MYESHWTQSCKGDGEGHAVVLIYRKIPWQWIKGEQVWQVNGLDCEGRCMFPAGRVWRFYPGIIYPGVVSYFDGSGYLTGYQGLVNEGLLPELDPEEVKRIDPKNLPDDIMLDKRSLKHLQNQCCPPQLASYAFEGVEMI